MDSFNIKKQLEKIITRVTIELSHGIIDDESLVSIEYFKDKDWRLVLFEYDNLSYIQVDLFVQALQKLNIDRVDTFLYNWEDIKYFKSVKSEYQSIRDIFYNIGATDKDWSSLDVVGTSIIVTNEALDFIVYIDSHREQYYFYGNKKFIDIVMPISFEAYRDFYEAYYDIFEDEPLHVDYLKWLWRHYAEPKN